MKKRLWVWDNDDYGWFEKGIAPMDKNGHWIEKGKDNEANISPNSQGITRQNQIIRR